jgi:uncharacterized integral membrane protein
VGHISLKFIPLLFLNAILILSSAFLLLRHFWQPAAVIMVGLFIVNMLLGPRILRVQSVENQDLDKNRSRQRFWGFALIASAGVHAVFSAGRGFSWPGVAGIGGGLIAGALLLFIAEKSKQPKR